MNKLFNSRNVIYENGEYTEVPDEDDDKELDEYADEEFDPYDGNEEQHVVERDEEDDA